MPSRLITTNTIIMEKQYLPLERERDFSQKINDTFQFIRLNFKDLSIALLLIVGPFLLISGIAGGLNQINFINSVGPAQEPLKPDASFEDILMKFSTQSRHSIGPVYYVFLLSYVLSMILLVVTVYGYMQCYLEDAASRITIERVTAKIKAHFIPVLNGLFLVLSIFFGILMLISLAFGALRVAMGDASGVVMALCIMGAFGVIIYFMIMFLLSPAIIIFEGASAGLLNASIVARELGLADKQENKLTLEVQSLSELMDEIGKDD